MKKPIKCMNCHNKIEENQKYKLEIPSNDPICESCWIIYERYLLGIEATDDLTKWDNQEILVR